MMKAFQNKIMAITGLSFLQVRLYSLTTIKLSLYNVMNNNQNFPFQSESLEMTVTSFQSMVNNLSGRIRKMKLRLQFKTQQQKADFQLALKRHQDRDEEEISLSDDEEHIQESIQLNETILSREAPRDQCFVIDQSFEMSILLRERFMNRLNDIGLRLSVKFMVIPEKVKILSGSSERIADAEDEYREIRNNIRFQNFTELSKEVYQSRLYKQKLRQSHVELIQILRKYYIWYQSHKTQPDQLITEVFHNTKHKIYSLTPFEYGRDQNMVAGQATVVHGQLDRVRGQERTTNTLITDVRAQLFQKYISSSLNQLENRLDRQVELSEDRRSLLLHLDADEQLQIQRKTIEEQYSPFKFIFLAFPKQVDPAQLKELLRKTQEQPSFKKSKDKIRTKINTRYCLVWQIKDNLVCVAYWSGQNNISPEDIEKHPLINFVRSIPQEMYNFKLAVQEMLAQPEDEDWCSRFIFEKNYTERVTFIGPKNQTANRYQEMFKLYLAGKFTTEYLTKNKAEESKQEASQATVDIVDMSRPANQTSLMMSNVLDVTVNKQQAEQKNDSVILPNQLVATVNFRFQNYTFLFREPAEDQAKKYSSDLDKIQIMKRSSNPDNFENAIKQATSYRYRYTKVRIPAKYKWNLQEVVIQLLKQHPEWKTYDRWVSVFAGGKQCKQVEGLFQKGERVRVYKVEKNNSMLEGYLLLTNLLFLLAEGTSQLPFGQYEITSFIKRVAN